jgi:nucleotide-binding universal stress UspA family protein
VTAPGQYRLLLEQIYSYWAWLKQEKGEDAPFSEAVAGWYDEIYLPLIKAMRRRGLLWYFPGRTETDLYAWIVRHREELQEELGWDVDDAAVARNLIDRFSPQPKKIFDRVKERVLEAITPEPFEAGPPPGHWRQDVVGEMQDESLFMNILVPVHGHEGGWRALDQALVVAQRDDSHIYGLHVVPDLEKLNRPAVDELQLQFEERCRAAGVDAEFSIEEGAVAATIAGRAYWSDLIVMPLSHPPGPRLGDRLSSGFSRLIRRVPRPVLAAPGSPSALDHPLLAFDGSPKAKEALFVAAYLAGKWQLSLTVLSAAPDEADEQKAAEALTTARQYLQSRRVDAFYVVERGPASEVIKRVAEAQNCDFIVMGGYGFQPLLDVVLGSTVNDVLRWRRWPVLVCR